MIVLDASVAVEVLLSTAVGRRVLPRLTIAGTTLHAPELLDVEVLQVLRRCVAHGDMTEARARDSVAVLTAWPVLRHAHGPLLRRCWQLRANLSAYDAAYVALAEGLGATLLTRDARLAKAPGIAATIEVV